MIKGLPSGMIDGVRAQFTDEIDEHKLIELAKFQNLRVIQHVSPVKPETYELLNRVLFSVRPDVEMRVYGHYKSLCDLSFAHILTNLRKFSADCLMRASGVEAVAEMSQLESLSIGIFNLENFDFLDRVSPTITSLALSRTKSKKPKLSNLSRFKTLKKLFLESQQNEIEVLRELASLEDLTLRSISLSNLSCLEPLESLHSLDIKLGGLGSLDGIEGKKSVRYLELWQVRNVHSVSVVACLPGLQHLFLQSLPHVCEFPSLATASLLRRVVVENMKSLRNFSAFELAPALEEFALIDGRSQEPRQLEPLLRNSSTTFLQAFFGSKRKNDEFAKLRKLHNKLEWHWSTPFQYR